MRPEQSATFLIGEAMGYTYAAALRAAAGLGLADHMEAVPRGAGEIAAAAGAEPDGVRRILRMLAARGVVEADGPDRFGLGPAGAALRGDAPHSVRQAVLMLTDDLFWRPSQVVGETVRTADPSFAEVFGCDVPQYFATDPAKEALFYAGMDEVSRAENDLVARVCPLPPTGTVADLGGRYGDFLSAVLHAHPGVEGVLLDTPAEIASHRLGALGPPGRWRVEAGDFLAGVPVADVHLLKRIVHNLDDEDAVRLLAHCRRALRPGGRVVVIDAIVPTTVDPHDSRPMDFMMLAALTGRERTAAELEPLFARAGLRLRSVVPTGTPMSLAVGEVA